MTFEKQSEPTLIEDHTSKSSDFYSIFESCQESRSESSQDKKRNPVTYCGDDHFAIQTNSEYYIAP